MSNYAPQVIAEELPGGLRLPDGVKTHNVKSMNAPFASGSNPPDAMVVIPCTMGTMGRIAHGYSEDVLLRAADVVLKEKKKLILVPRETPISLIHVKNMELLLLAGATLIPANPSFYSGAKTIVELADTVVARALDHIGVVTKKRMRPLQSPPPLRLERRPPARRAEKFPSTSRAGGRRSDFCRGLGMR